MSSERSAKLINLVLLLGPFFAFLLLFWLIPLGFGINLSLQSKEASLNTADEIYQAPMGPGVSWDQRLAEEELKNEDSSLSNAPRSDPEYVGIANYSKIWNDLQFRKAIHNTILYMVALIIITLPLSFLLALLIRNSFRSTQSAISLALLLPALTLPAILGTLFHLVFHGKQGILNQLVVMPLGFPPVNWMMDPTFILPAMALQAIWRWTGFITLFYLCALEAIPKVQYEAARLEGAGWRQTLTSVPLPGVRHVTIFAGIFLGVDAIASFSGAYSLLGGSGGTMDAGLLLVTYVYKLASPSGGQLDYPAATAASLLVAPIVALAAWLILHFTKQRETAS
jgi:multiple sugar transport system permease protein